MKSSNLHATIMRRVYYSYALSFITHSMLWRGVVLGAAAVLLADWLHVASIFQNFLAVPVGKVPTYVFNSIWNAAASGELTTVLLAGLAVAIGCSTLWRFLHVLPLARRVSL